MKAGKYFEVSVYPNSDTVVKAAPITEGEDLTAAQNRSTAMAKAKGSLRAAVEQALRSNIGFRATRLRKWGHGVQRERPDALHGGIPSQAIGKCALVRIGAAVLADERRQLGGRRRGRRAGLRHADVGAGRGIAHEYARRPCNGFGQRVQDD